MPVKAARPVFITLGSNVEPDRNLPGAVRLLHEGMGVRRVSRVYRSTPLGPDGEVLAQAAYLNAAVLIEVPLDMAPDLLKHRVLRPIEVSMDRVRGADKYAARPIDLDIALFGDLVLNDPANHVTIPDPEIITRAHVALPLADLAPDFVHPVTGQALAEIAARFVSHPGISVHPVPITF